MQFFFRLHLILLILSSVNGKIISDDSGDPGEGDCEPYKDESCLKLYDNAGLMTYEDAESFCVRQSSHLTSIASQDKQNFIENFLKTHNVFDNVWLGLKFTNGNYEWLSGNKLTFSNWADGSPKNTSDECVQMTTDDVGFGKWSDVVCLKKNAVFCEKKKVWSADEIQNALIKLIQNPVPIGFIYVQLPNEKLPGEIWPSVVWKDVSSDYAGLFFRTEGGESSSFGEIQEESTYGLWVSPRYTPSWYPSLWQHGYSEVTPDSRDAVMYLDKPDGFPNSDPVFGLRLNIDHREVRPRNTAIRIWRRTE